MYTLDKTSRKIQHSMRGNYIHSSLSKVYNLQFTCVFIILPLITVGAVWWLCFYILVMSCAFCESHFSNILTELWSSILKTFDPLPGGSFNNNSVILQLGSRRYPISEMDLAKQGLKP